MLSKLSHRLFIIYFLFDIFANFSILFSNDFLSTKSFHLFPSERLTQTEIKEYKKHTKSIKPIDPIQIEKKIKENEKSKRKTVCLNMIVKNESKTITRCFNSVKSIIDYIVVVDTGSTDNTQEIMKEYMKKHQIPGEIHERPWKNFEHNRNEALAFAKGKGDYLLLMDADDTLKFDLDFKLPNLTADCYYCVIENGQCVYDRQLLIKNSLDWKWKGVLHEYLNCPNCKSHVKINGVKKIYFSDGARSQDPKKHEKDAQVLEEALKDDPTNSRYVFYLAQSYRNARDYASALKNYEKRAQMDGGNEEIFLSKLEIAKMQEALNKPIEITAKSYLDAYDYRPSRAEPLFYAAQLYRIHNDFEKAYKIATQGIVIPMPKDILFVEKWIYDFGMEYELAKNAYWIGHYEECQKLCQNLLSNNKLPENIRQIVEKMLSLANQQILKKFQNQFQS